MPTEATDHLRITPSLVTWARTRAGLSIDDAKRHFRRIEEWESGSAFPTYHQIEAMSERFKCPVAVFFFPEPPVVPSVENSFRTLRPADFDQIPRTVKAFLRKAQAMQINLSELNDGKNPAPKLLTRELILPPSATRATIATRLREFLGVSLQEQSTLPTVEQALEHWRDALARVGVYVFKDAFRAPGFFGFCLYDAEFPVIFLNNSSSKSRQIFTLPGGRPTSSTSGRSKILHP
jgi:hypothetical protein